MEYWDSIYRKIIEYSNNVEHNTIDRLYNYIKNKGTNKGPLKYEVCLTNNCNQKCIHCSNGIKDKHSSIRMELISSLLEQEPILIILTGGEPFLHPDVFSIIYMIKKRGVFLKICTNGVYLTESVCKKLEVLLDENDIIQISFDAADSDTYTSIRGSEDFNTVMANILNARKILSKVTIDLHCVPNVFNFKQIESVFDLAKALGANTFSASPLAYLGCAKKEYQANVLSLLQLELELYKNSNAQTSYTGRLFEICSLYGLVNNISSSCEINKKVYHCDAGVSSLYIDCNGAVYPCVYLKAPDFCLGYANEGIDMIIERAKMQYIEGYSIVGTNCENCYLWGHCNGGCIGVAYGTFRVAKPGMDPRCGQFNKDKNICLEKGGI